MKLSVPSVLVALVCLGACESDQVMPAGTLKATGSAQKPIDRLAPGELGEGKADAFGLTLPRELVIDARFPEAVHASGPVTPEALANYVRTRVDVAHVEIGAARTVFPRARIKAGAAEKTYRIEVVPDGARTRLVVRDITPAPTIQGISEEERWRRAGMKPNGELIAPNKQQ